MGTYSRLLEFVQEHRPCGTDTVAVSPERPTREGYRLIASCTCGARFDKWVTPLDARADLVFTTILASRN
jgi:hypothetical protein